MLSLPRNVRLIRLPSPFPNPNSNPHDHTFSTEHPWRTVALKPGREDGSSQSRPAIDVLTHTPSILAAHLLSEPSFSSRVRCTTWLPPSPLISLTLSTIYALIARYGNQCKRFRYGDFPREGAGTTQACYHCLSSLPRKQD